MSTTPHDALNLLDYDHFHDTLGTTHGLGVKNLDGSSGALFASNCPSKSGTDYDARNISDYDCFDDTFSAIHESGSKDLQFDSDAIRMFSRFDSDRPPSFNTGPLRLDLNAESEPAFPTSLPQISPFDSANVEDDAALAFFDEIFQKHDPMHGPSSPMNTDYNFPSSSAYDGGRSITSIGASSLSGISGFGPNETSLSVFNTPDTPELIGLAAGLQPPCDLRPLSDDTQALRHPPDRQTQGTPPLSNLPMPRSGPFGDLHTTVRGIDERLHELEALSKRRFDYLYDRLNSVDQALQAQIQDSHQYLESKIADIRSAQSILTAHDAASSWTMSCQTPAPLASTRTQLVRRCQNVSDDLDEHMERQYDLADSGRPAGGHVARPSNQAHGRAPSLIMSRRSRTSISTRGAFQVDGVKKSRFSEINGRHYTESSALCESTRGAFVH